MPKRPFCDAIKIQEINVEIQHSNLYKISEEYDLASPSIRVQTFGITKAQSKINGDKHRLQPL